jgi:hypothetical protein
MEKYLYVCVGVTSDHVLDMTLLAENQFMFVLPVPLNTISTTFVPLLYK